MSKIKVADYIINTLADMGIDKIFVVYGAANGNLIDAFTRTSKTKYICCYHEQAAGFAQECYAKCTGKIGVSIQTSGPGGTNQITSCCNHFYDSVPGLFITGQINSKFMKPNDEIRQIGFQETNIIDIVKPITKYAVCVKRAEDIKYELEKLLYMAVEGRPGPVWLDIPLNIQAELINPDELIGFDPEPLPKYIDGSFNFKLETLLDDLYNAQKPVLLVGGGCYKYRKGVNDLINILKIPVFPTWNAIDIVTSDNPYYAGRVGTYGGPGYNFAIQQSDLIIGLGTRFSGRITGGNVESFGREAKIYSVDIDPANLQQKTQQVIIDTPILSDIGAFIIHFIHKTITISSYWNTTVEMLSNRKKWLNQTIDFRNKYDPTIDMKPFNCPENTVHPYQFMDILSQECGPQDTIIADCGGNVVIWQHNFKSKFGQRLITNNGHSPMGFSFAGAIGAALSGREKNGNIIVIIGDGGFQMNLQELGTIFNNQLPIKTFIINNHSYGITKAYQKVNFEGREEACSPKTGYYVPNFINIAEAYGISGSTLISNNKNDIHSYIRKVLDADGPYVSSIECKDYHRYVPRIVGWSTSIEDMETNNGLLPIQDLEANMDNVALLDNSYERRGVKRGI